MSQTWIELPPSDIASYVEAETERQIKEILQSTFDEIVDRTPVASGRLKSGWTYDGQDTIFNNVPYAGVVEVGTSSRLPAAMVDTTLNDFEQIVQKVLQ